MKTTESITSRDNDKLVNARKVRDGKVRTKIFIEGSRLAGEALRSDLFIEECLLSDEFNDLELVDSIRKRTKNISRVADRLFKTIADTNQPQGIVLIACRPSFGDLDAAIQRAKFPLVLFLNEINNPSNLGAILRTAEAAGIVGLIVSENSADPYSPKSIRSSMGSSFRLRVWENANFDQAIDWAKERGLRVTAADVSAKTGYTAIDWKQPRLLVFGSEAHGLSPHQLSDVKEKILIPMENRVESLNLGVSAGIILFEAKRQIDR